MAILVLADQSDTPTDRIVKTLTDRGADVFRLDTHDFPRSAGITGVISDSRPWQGFLETDHRSVALDAVTAVYYRTPRAFDFRPDMSGPERQYAAAQARAGLGGIICALDCRWMSHPAAMSRAEYKPVQLAAARRAGLQIPKTIITNRADDARNWADSIDGPIITKPLASPILVEGSNLKTVYTTLLKPSDLDDLRGLDVTAHLFQAWVDKAHEVRLTVAGDQLLAAAIHAGSVASHVDWRSDYPALTYEQTEVPDHVAEAVHDLMYDLDLRYGALDFIVDPDGRWWFLEVNPCGQWDWIQHHTGLQIAEAIADELMGVHA